jgi:Sigma-70, region 4
LSAVLQLPLNWAAPTAIPTLQAHCLAIAAQAIRKQVLHAEARPPTAAAPEPVVSYAFYRKHTENLLRRYLYASTQVGRSPNLLGESVGRGWVSSRKVRTFEDALIFVLDVERCLNRLLPIQRQLISRIILQEYTQAEAAVMLGISTRTISVKLPLALDCLTESLLEAELLVLPD